MRSSAGVSVVVVTRNDESVAAINSTLRERGHAAHCRRAGDAGELEELCAGPAPDLVLLFADEVPLEPAAVTAQLRRLAVPPPLLLVARNVDEAAIAAALDRGCRDVVSMTHRQRLISVVERELEAHRLRHALGGVLSSAHQYKQELRDLMEGASEAIADVQEGIVVAANPAWLRLFCYADEAAIVGTPIMDLHQEGDQPILKGALVACLKGQWNGDPLHVTARRADGEPLQLDVRLEKATIDGEAAVRVVIPNEAAAEQTPAELLEQAVYKDPSTGFYQRHHFLEQLEARLAEPLGEGIRALAYVRPDSFARAHDDVGLLGTEALLMRFAEVLRGLTQPADLYGRFGGTIFTVLLQRGTIEDARAWAETLCRTIGKHVFEVEKNSTALTCTVGLAEVTGDATVSELLADAEMACRTGRDAGGNRVEMSSNASLSMTTQRQDALWIPRIRNALMQNRLRLVHQPVTSLNEEIHGVFDTRVRMLDEQNELVLPREFIPAADRGGLLKNIDRWVIGASLSFCAAKQPTMVFVRLSRDSVDDAGLEVWLGARLARTRVEPGKICFQVAESVAAQNLKGTKRLAERLRATGFRFAVDHLGAGRDSAQILTHVPMDYVKIDGSLMQGLHRNSAGQETVRRLADIAREHGIGTIAERVEDANTMAVLWQIGVAHVQGNYNQMHGVVLEDTQTVRGLAAGALAVE